MSQAHQALPPPAPGPLHPRVPRRSTARSDSGASRCRFFLAAPHRLAAGWCPVPAGGSGQVSGPGIRANTRTPIHMRTPFPATSGGTCGRRPACKPGWPGARRLAHAHTLARSRTPAAHGGWITHARGHARRLRARRPPGTRGGLCARAALVPAPSRPRPGGGACWGRVLRHRPGSSASWAAPATSSSSSSSGSEPAERSQGRAEGSEGAGGAGHGAMAHQTGIHGEGGWRAGRGRGSPPAAAPPPRLRLPSPPGLQRGEASCSLLQPRTAWGGTSGGGGLTVQSWEWVCM